MAPKRRKPTYTPSGRRVWIGTGRPARELAAKLAHKLFFHRQEKVEYERGPAVWIEAPLREQWTVAFRLIPQEGRIVVGEVRVFPREKDRKEGGVWSGERSGLRAEVPEGGIPARMLREIRIDDYLRRIREVLEVVRDQLGEEEFRSFWPMPEPERSPRPRRGGRPRLSDHELALLARDYVEAHRGGSHKPVAEVARKHSLSESTARARIAEARSAERGILSPAAWGKAGGELTDKARELLSRRGDERRAPKDPSKKKKEKRHATKR